MSQPTPGPWAWFTNSNGPYLATPDRGHLLVMDFARKGMNGAQPRFAVWKGDERERMGGLMRRAEELDLVEHPDAKLIASAPDLLAACKAIADAWEADEIGQLDEGVIELARAAITKAETGVSQ